MPVLGLGFRLEGLGRPQTLKRDPMKRSLDALRPGVARADAEAWLLLRNPKPETLNPKTLPGLGLRRSFGSGMFFWFLGLRFRYHRPRTGLRGLGFRV